MRHINILELQGFCGCQQWKKLVSQFLEFTTGLSIDYALRELHCLKQLDKKFSCVTSIH